jgi:hypothetical protein
LKVTNDFEVTRKKDGSIHLNGFKDDVIKHKEIINNLIIQHCDKIVKSMYLKNYLNIAFERFLKNLENFSYEFPNTWVDGNDSEAEYQLVKVQQDSPEFMTVYKDFIKKMGDFQLKKIAVSEK